MEVSGVLISCETFVMSSVLKRSLFTLSATAFAMPVWMLLRRSPCSFKSRYMCVVSTGCSISPSARRSPPSARRFICKTPQKMHANSTTFTRRHPAPMLLPVCSVPASASANIAIQKTSPALKKSGRFRVTAPQSLPITLSTM